MHVDSPDDSWKDDRRLRGDAGFAGHHLNSAKAGNGLSAAKAGGGPTSAGDRQREPSRSSTSPARTAPRLELSLTQILGSTGAAVTAAFLGSRLGVAGTLIGAALASVISVVGGALYTTSLKATRQQVTKVLVGRTDEESSGSPGALPLLPGAPAVAPSAGRREIRDRRADAATGRPARRARPVLRGAVAGALLSAVVFAGALLVVTGVESVTGSALSGGSAGSLTILGGHDAGAGRTTRPATPTSPPATSVSPITGSSSGSPSGSSTAPTTASTTVGSSTASSTGSGTAPSTVTTTTTASPSTGTSLSTGSAAATQQTAGTSAPAGTAPTDTAAPGAAPDGASRSTTPAGGASVSAPAGASPGSTPTGPTAESTPSSVAATSGRPAPGALVAK